MFGRTRIPMACRKYEARLEDYLGGIVDPELNEHLSRCVHCRAALDHARPAGALVREAWEPAGEMSRDFLTGVMTRIRTELERAASPAAFWSPLEFLATRLSLTAAMLLLALSVYWVGFTPRRNASPPGQADVTAAWVDSTAPPTDPIGKEEVLLSLAENNE